MKKIKGLLLAVTLMLSAEGMAQSFVESALLFSRTKPGGSARIQSLGGAQVSLGGDYSSAFSNPAGLGMYNRSEFSFSPAQYVTSINGDYLADDNTLSASNKDDRFGIQISGLGLAISSNQAAKNSFLRGTFGITLNRINDFNKNIRYSARNRSSSLIDFFLEDASGRNPSQFEEDGALFNTVTELAYNNYLIGESTILDPNNDPRQYFTDIDEGRAADQQENIQTRGGQNQWSFSYGANFDDRFFLGAGLGIGSLRYSSKKTFREDFNDEPINNYTLDEELDIRGSSINLTIGGIARPIDLVQIGLSMTTPTYYNLVDNFSARMRSSWDNFDYYGDGSDILTNESSQTDIITSEYDLTTPWRLNVGATFFLKKLGFITADIEQVNYTKARYSSQISGIEFGSDNDRIKSLYRATTNVRVGSEIRWQSWRFRGGYQFLPEPFNTKQNGVSRVMQTFSSGVGYRTADFFIDGAVIYSMGKNSYRPYTIDSNDSPLLIYNQRTTQIMFTVGFIF